MENPVAREKIVAQLRRMTGPSFQHVAITDDTEIYYDLRIFGHDLYDFLVWVNREFGVPIDIDINVHAPREGMPPLFFRNWRERREREKRPYESLTVRHILELVQRQRSGD